MSIWILDPDGSGFASRRAGTASLTRVDDTIAVGVEAPMGQRSSEVGCVYITVAIGVETFADSLRCMRSTPASERNSQVSSIDILQSVGVFGVGQGVRIPRTGVVALAAVAEEQIVEAVAIRILAELLAHLRAGTTAHARAVAVVIERDAADVRIPALAPQNSA